MKEDLPFFEHDNHARHHPKMKALLAEFGWAGIGRFWSLNEAICCSSKAILDVSKKVTKASMAVELGLSMAEFEAFLVFLSDPNECGLITYKDGKVTTERTQESYRQVEEGRIKARNRKNKTIDGHPDTASPESPVTETFSVNDQSSPEHTQSSPEPYKSIKEHNRTEQNTSELKELPQTPKRGLELPGLNLGADGDYRKPADITPLFTSVRKTFQDKGGVAWGKAELEVEAIHWLIGEFGNIAAREQRAPEDVAQDILGRFWKMRETGRDFWKTQPYTPRRLQSVWEQLLTETSAKPAATKFTAATYDPSKPNLTVEAM